MARRNLRIPLDPRVLARVRASTKPEQDVGEALADILITQLRMARANGGGPETDLRLSPGASEAAERKLEERLAEARDRNEALKAEIAQSEPDYDRLRTTLDELEGILEAERPWLRGPEA